MYFKTLFKICWKQQSHSSVDFPTRAWLPSLERTANSWKSTGCTFFMLDWRSTHDRAWDSDSRSSADYLARANCKTHELLGICISRSSVTSYARAEVHVLRVYARAWSPPLEHGSKSGISRLIRKHKTQPLKLQTRSFWGNFLENTYKLIIQHVLKVIS